MYLPQKVRQKDPCQNLELGLDLADDDDCRSLESSLQENPIALRQSHQGFRENVAY